jgi:hypothetical protein
MEIIAAPEPQAPAEQPLPRNDPAPKRARAISNADKKGLVAALKDDEAEGKDMLAARLRELEVSQSFSFSLSAGVDVARIKYRGCPNE